MSPHLSDRTRRLLSQSIPFFELHKHEVMDRMQAGLAIGEPERNAGQAEVNAMLLVKMLISQVRHVLKTGAFDDIGHIPREHEAQHITGRTYSRFGDLLVPVLKDAFGPNVPNTVPGAWVDAFWALIRATTAQPALEPA